MNTSISSKLRGSLYLNLMRLYYWLQVRAARKAVHLKRLCCSLLDAEIRFLKPDLLQLGEDDRLDYIVEYVARQLTGGEILPELQSFAGENLVFDLLDLAQQSDEVKNVIARYHATDAFFAGLLKDDVRKKGQMELARAASPELAEYDAGAVYREHTKTVTRLGKLRKQLAERSALKVEFSIAGISGSIALITAVFVVAGFLYVHYFYRRMGVDVSLYFSVSDYLAASVEQIRAGALAAAVALGTFALGIGAGSRRSRLQIRATATMRRRESWFVGFFTLMLVGISAYAIYIGKPEFSQLRLTGVVLSYWLADYISSLFFRNHLVAMTAMVGTMVFGVNVGVAAYERTEQLLHPKDEVRYVQQLRFKEESPPAAGELFGANSSYYFIYERHSGITHVVPRDRVAQIDIVKKTK
jgi:hypothetical protein